MGSEIRWTEERLQNWPARGAMNSNRCVREAGLLFMTKNKI
jgi:hypothetical protein